MICSTKNQASNCGYIAERASVGFSTLSGGIICKGGYYVVDRDLPDGLFWKENKQNKSIYAFVSGQQSEGKRLLTLSLFISRRKANENVVPPLHPALPADVTSAAALLLPSR
jgi:hypothetical protein